jgi:hypothetical protein
MCAIYMLHKFYIKCGCDGDLTTIFWCSRANGPTDQGTISKFITATKINLFIWELLLAFGGGGGGGEGKTKQV